MVKDTQTIRRQKPMTCLSVFDHFVGLLRKGLSTPRVIAVILGLFKISSNISDGTFCENS